MKNGRFSLKNVGNRWFTSTWKASLSTWLKSGLTVASSVMLEVIPYFRLAPRLPFETVLLHVAPAGRTWLPESVALGITSSSRGCLSVPNTTGTCDSNTHLPGGISGHDHEIPKRLLRRKNMTPIATSVPALEADALERDPHLDDVAFLVDLAGALPRPVWRRVFVGRLQRIHLHAAGVDEHVIRHLAGTARIEAHRHPVVTPGVVAPA